MIVAIGSSWLVMLYGLRLGYQTSVDWLTSFFSGLAEDILWLQPVKVLFFSILYIIVLRQHINLKETANLSVHGKTYIFFIVCRIWVLLSLCINVV